MYNKSKEAHHINFPESIRAKWELPINNIADAFPDRFPV
jgi:hypothetical protein